MPRIVPNRFLLIEMKILRMFLVPEFVEYRKNSGKVWGIHMELTKGRDFATLYLKNNLEISSDFLLLDKQELVGKISRFLY